MHASPELGVSNQARRMAHGLLSGAGSWIPIPRWYQAMTADWLPLRFRAEFGLEIAGADQASLLAARRRIPRLYARLPSAARFVGPWHQAQARLAGRSPGLIARLSNRFWIGQMLLPFAGG